MQINHYTLPVHEFNDRTLVVEARNLDDIAKPVATESPSTRDDQLVLLPFLHLWWTMECMKQFLNYFCKNVNVLKFETLLNSHNTRKLRNICKF